MKFSYLILIYYFIANGIQRLLFVNNKFILFELGCRLVRELGRLLDRQLDPTKYLMDAAPPLQRGKSQVFPNKDN